MSQAPTSTQICLIDQLERAIEDLDYLRSLELVRILRLETLRGEILVDGTSVGPRMSITPSR